jgi:putative membrane protein
MYLRSHLLCLTAAATILAGIAFSQNPGGLPQGQPGQQQPGTTQQPGTRMPGSNYPSEQTPGTIGTQDQRPSDPLAFDRKFVKDAAEGSMVEVELGKLAQEKGSNDAVKEFGKRMVDDHSKANEDLKQAAAKANIQVPAELPKKAKKVQDKLSKLSGAEFDRVYAKMMLSDHKDDVKSFEKESKAGQAPEVKNFAAKTLPTLQEHLKMAEQLEASTKGGPKKGPETSSR